MNIRCMSCMGEFDEKFTICPHCGYVRGTAAAEPHHMQPGTIINKKYIVGKVLGFGGFGVTYIGWDAMLNTKVAIKEYLPSEFATRIPGQTEISVYDGQSRSFFKSGLDSFVQEAQRLAKFSSEDGIVRIYDTFTENNTAYIVMEYLDGETVASKIKNNGPMSYAAAMEIIRPVLNTLEKVHNVGIIHRDISPDNILVTKDGKVKILDFGSARYATAYNTRSLSVIVKRGYAPPEQYVKNAPQGAWTDNYAVAATLYKMLTGVTPVESIDRKDTVLALPSNMGSDIPEMCQNALMNALNCNAQNRPQTAGLFLNGLISGQALVKEEKEKDKTKFPVWLKVLSGAVAAIVVILGLLFATGTFKIVSGRLIVSNPFSQSDMVNVPDVLKKTKEDAEEILNEKQLSLLVVGKKAFEEDIEKDLICEQTPDGGQQAEKDSVVEVKISGGPAVGYVPPAVFYTQEAAQQNFEDEGLNVKIEEEYNDEVGAGGVISQSQSEGTELRQNEEVTLVVSKGPETRPSGSVTLGNLVGKDFETARRELLEQGLYLLIEEAEYDDEAPENTIIMQKTSEGTSVDKGSNVYVTISLGKEKVRVPDVQYLNEDEAIDALEDLGLVVNVEDGHDDAVDVGLVMDQSADRGELIEKGSEITITVNRGGEAEEEEEEEESEEVEETTIGEGTVSGSVKDSVSNAALAGVTVEVVDAENAENVVDTVETDASGNYTVRLEAGNYILRMNKDGYNEFRKEVTVEADGEVDAATAKMVKIETKGKLTGSVVDSASGAALAGVTVSVVKASDTSAVVKTFRTNSAGNYTVELETGSYVLKMTMTGYNNLNVSATVQADKNITVPQAKMVKMATVGKLTGTVVDKASGAALSGVTIKVTKSDGTVVKTITTNNAGKYTVDVDAGSYVLKMTLTGYNALNVNATAQANKTITVTQAKLVKIPVEKGKITGATVDSVTGASIPGVTIKVVKKSDNSVVKTFQSNSAGNFTVELEEGDYVLKMSMDGYKPLNMNATVQKDQNITIPTAKLVRINAATTPVSGTITNAVNGQPVAGVTIKVREGLNTTTGSYLSYSATTNSEGKYSFNLPAGSYTLEASKSGFIKAHIPVSPAGTAITTANTAISPVVESGNMRIVLTWGSTPNDLDSHLSYSDNGSYKHVYYGQKSGSFNGNSAVQLDVDDTTAYGPETITITQPSATEYTYYVYNYSGSPSITESEARVVVYSGNSIVQTFNVPTTGSGRTWNVFKIVNGRVVPVNTIS